ncbi:MAG: NSS family neurotransmitter:Na+ symporter [Myxococcota bacterium]|jgi:NSS family neurotransmitter:Na+ symporter
MTTPSGPELLGPSPHPPGTPGGRGEWGSRAGFILAAAGSAVGLGNIWKFPYITGENGGGLFVLIYLACILLVGLPIMVAELMIGRAARQTPVIAFEKIEQKKTGWSVIGWIGVLAGFIILSFYIVVAGWSMDYTLKSVANFTTPIAEMADQEAKVQRASTPLDTMREKLGAERAKRRASAPVGELRRQATKAEWTALGTYDAAIKKAGETGVDVGLAQEALLEDPEFKALVEHPRKLTVQIAAANAAAQTEASQYLAGVSDLEVRDAYETLVRRASIAESVGGAFGKVISDGWTATFWALLFMCLVILIISSGVAAGIEKVSRILMPLLIGVMLFMVVYGAFQPGFGDAAEFVFSPDPSRLKASGFLEALGHAFFTLSLGMGAMMTYGSYMGSRDGLVRQSMWIAGLDTAIALLACLMIFPIIFSYGQDPSAGPGLVFASMPIAFAQIGGGGMLLAILFFGLLVVAALTSAISLLEVVASYFIDAKGWSRKKAAWVVGGAVFLFGLPSAFSFDEGFAMASWEPTFGKTFFDTMDYLASNWLLPIGGLLIAVYAGWFMPKRVRDAELKGSGAVVLKGWLVLIRFVAPALVLLVVLQKVGILSVD